MTPSRRSLLAVPATAERFAARAAWAEAEGWTRTAPRSACASTTRRMVMAFEGAMIDLSVAERARRLLARAR